MTVVQTCALPISLGTLHNSSKKDNVFLSANGFITRGTIGNHIGFHIDVRDSKEWGSRSYPEKFVTTMPGRGFAVFKGDHAEFDESGRASCRERV